MNPQDIRPYLKRDTFRPFRIEMADGQHFDIPFPNLVLLPGNEIHIGIPPIDSDEHYAEKVLHFPVAHVRQITVLSPTMS